MKRYALWPIITIALFSANIVCVKQKLKGKKIVMVVGERMFVESEFTRPKEVLDKEGAHIIIASSTLSEATSMGGSLKLKPHILVRDLKVEDFDAILFVGGPGAGDYFNDDNAHRIIKKALNRGKKVTAICAGVRVLANAGILKGKKVCGTDAYLKTMGAILTGRNIERDGNIITAVSPVAGKEFGEAITSALVE